MLNNYKRKMWIVITGFVISLFLSASLFAQDISPLLVGSNVWYNPGAAQWTSVGRVGVQIMRIGGHAFDDNMPSDSQLKQWIAEIKKIGAEPMIQVSQYGSNRAANAARLVKLFNVDNPEYYVKYWNVGNEPWLQAGKPSWSTITPKIAAYFKEIVPEMKAVDPTIKVFGPDICYYESQAMNALFGGANDISGKVPGQDYYYCDGISWHKYSSGDLSHDVLESFHGNIRSCKTRVDYANNKHNRTGDEALGWGIGEFNADAGGGLPCTFDAGQMFAGIFMYCMQYEATYATNWSIKEGGSSCSGTDFGFLNGNNSPRSTAAHMHMIQKMTGAFLAGTSSYNEVLVFGSQNDSTICAMIVNRSSTGQNYTIRLDDNAVSENELKLSIDAGLAQEFSDYIGGDESQLIIYNAAGEALEKWTYNSQMSGQWPDVLGITLDDPPAAPTDLAAETVDHRQINLSWSDNSDNEARFHIERRSGGADFEVVGTVEKNTVTYRDMQVMDSTLYSYRVRAFNYGGYSDYSNEASATTKKAPPQTPYKGPHTIPGKIQAEDFDIDGEGYAYHDTDDVNAGDQYRRDEGVDIEACTDNGGGYNVGWIESGEWLEYTMSTIEAGIYNVNLRVASDNNTSTKRVTIKLNDVLLGRFYPTYTGGWQNWQTLTLNDVSIPAGEGLILRLEFGGSDFNLNYIEFESSTGVVEAQHDVSTPEMFYLHQNYPNPFNPSTQIKYDIAEPGLVSLHVFNVLGKQVAALVNEFKTAGQYNATFDGKDLPNGIYLVRLQVGDFVDMKKMIFAK
jgi:hypothetical protein